jgi:kinetochore protein Mis13/DSN1
LSRQANQKEIEVIHQTKAKQQAYRPPDMTSLPDPWMKDALSLADEIVQGGEGDLMSMGEFADVEYKASFTCAVDQWIRRRQLTLV